MSHIVRSATQLISHTPLLEVCRMENARHLGSRVLLKLEGRNPGGSVKDRVAMQMILEGENRGVLGPGGTIIEATSGNTGIGLCAIAAARGYRCIIVMPDSMSIERRQLVTAFGGELVLTPGSAGMAGAQEKARLLAREIPGSILAGQFENPANPLAHYRTTGPEIWADTDGQVDVLIAGIGTGGTITGTGRFLKEKNPDIRILGVEPADSPLLTKGYSGPHAIEGIGANFVPPVLDLTVVDGVIPVRTEDAYAAARSLGREEGVLCGVSGGAALHAALELAAKPEHLGQNIVVILPDFGERYLSTPLFSQN